MKRKEFIQLGLMTPITALSVDPIGKKIRTLLKSDQQPKIVRANEGKKVNVIGDTQTFKLTGQDTGGLFTLIEEENEPGVMVPMHVHSREDEVFKVLEGQVELTVGNETTILNAGDLGFGPRGVPHSWKIVGDKKARVILSVFPSGIEVMFEELGKLPPGPPDFPKVAEICSRFGIEFLPA